MQSYQLLCMNGSRKSVEEYKDCYLAKEPFRAVIGRKDADSQHIYKVLKQIPDSDIFSSAAVGEASTYYVVAVVRKGSGVTWKTLKGKKSCHTGLNRNAGWKVPDSAICGQTPDCTLYKFFSKGCAPGADPNTNMCELCKGSGKAVGDESKCKASSDEIYYGYDGAFRCLAEKTGDVAFIKHTIVGEYTDGKRQDWAKDLKSDDFELICPESPDISVKHTEFVNCNLAKVPAHAVITREDARTDVVNVLKQAQANTDVHLFKSEGERNLLFSDSTKCLQEITKPLGEFLTKKYTDMIEMTYETGQGPPGILLAVSSANRLLPSKKVVLTSSLTLRPNTNILLISLLGCLVVALPSAGAQKVKCCVKSQNELMKCQYLATKAPELECLLKSSVTECMWSIMKGEADAMTADGQHIYQAGLRPYDLRSVITNTVMLWLWCLKNGHGQVAFVCQDAIPSSEMQSYQLLCMNGSRKSVEEYKDCYLAKEPFRAVIGRKDADSQHIYKVLKQIRDSDIFFSAAFGGYFKATRALRENCDDSGEASSYYVVAVVRKGSGVTWDNLRGKTSCHTGLNTDAGWKVPDSAICGKTPDCTLYSFFSKGCAPGADPKSNLCELCKGSGKAVGDESKCKASSDEIYYGYDGAFRCLAEKTGDVAFIKHTIVGEYTDGKRQDCAKDLKSDDFELIYKLFESVGERNLLFSDSTKCLQENTKPLEDFLTRKYIAMIERTYETGQGQPDMVKACTWHSNTNNTITNKNLCLFDTLQIKDCIA
ncbi:hypothetical protein G5714_001630 [Onychostoma macrolepis]|uniref:Transferrin-like domain-containing protein n=1 Tax=Onychostoma macrolepis TaxID=369639 RepID=A0A7J6DCP0_9TELE|nr:hypothetical protein G5714_001630 [Onychostoma macrolepis]